MVVMALNKSQSKYFNTARKMDKALISILEEKPFEYITVSEICKRAEVNRSTFYLHYENTVDLLNEAARYLLDDFSAYFDVDKDVLSAGLMECPLDELNFISDKYLNPYLSYIRENRCVFRTVLSHSEAIGFNNIFHRLYENIFNPILERFDYQVSDRKYVMKFYLNGITSVVTEWLNDGCEKSIPEISHIIRQCIFGKNNID